MLYAVVVTILRVQSEHEMTRVSIVCINVLFVQTLTDMTTFANAMWQCVGWELCFPWPPHSGELGRWRWANIWNTLRLLLPSRLSLVTSPHCPSESNPSLAPKSSGDRRCHSYLGISLGHFWLVDWCGLLPAMTCNPPTPAQLWPRRGGAWDHRRCAVVQKGPSRT